MRVPRIPDEQVSHDICPNDLPVPADRDGAWDTAVRIFGLAVPNVCAHETDIGGEMEFMTHVADVPVRHCEERL
jgi:hypothetical protein